MKKQIAIFFFLIFIAAGLAAETGYRGHKWYSLSVEFPSYGREQDELAGWGIILTYPKLILQKENYLFYGFSFDYELINAGYVIGNEDVPKLKKQLQSLQKTELKADIGDKHPDQELKDLKKDGPEEFKMFREKDDLRFYYDQLAYTANGIEVLGTADIQKGPAFITIYDYNDDTRIYLFENVLKDKTVVVYVPHEQNY